jgi:hypothetical protein
MGDPGTPIAGSIGFDPDTLSSLGSGLYSLGGSPAVLRIENSSQASLTFLLSDIGITDGDSDFWTVRSAIPGIIQGGYMSAAFSLVDSTGAAISSTDYFTPTSLESWTQAVLSISLTAQGQGVVWFAQIAVTQLSVVPAPEPTWTGLAGIALGLLGIRRVLAR